MVPLKDSMLEAGSTLGLVVQGLRTNLFGLGCPFYCTSPSVGALAASFLLGLVLGVGLCAWLLYRFDFVPVFTSASSTPVPSASRLSSPPSGRARSALLEYLHEQQPRRRNWGFRGLAWPSGYCGWCPFSGGWFPPIPCWISVWSCALSYCFCWFLRGCVWGSQRSCLWFPGWTWTWDQGSDRFNFCPLPWPSLGCRCTTYWLLCVWPRPCLPCLDCWFVGKSRLGLPGAQPEPDPSDRLAVEVLRGGSCGRCWLSCGVQVFLILLACHRFLGQQHINLPVLSQWSWITSLPPGCRVPWSRH